ncbi:MAG: GAF domain-containing protein [Candidatus Aminicenantes bacterium]|nr:GAF domain-containing protein [Candidatus Aminicenantes bacterium]
MNKKVFLILCPTLALLVLGGLNIFKKATWTEPTDGVIWEERLGALTAIHVEQDSPAYLAGIKKGDILYKINDVPVQTKIDIAKNLWIAESSNQKVIYEIIHEGDQIFPSLNYLGKKGTNLIYFFLVLIGFTTIVLGLIVFLTSAKPFSLPYVFFFIISLVLYSFYIFSPTGKLDTLDSLFFWLDKIAFLVFPPLLLHFFLIFPKRKKELISKITSTNVLYLPAIVLLLAKIFICSPNIFKMGDSFILRFYQTSEKLDLLHFAALSLVAFAFLLWDTLKAKNLIIKRQMKWITYGLGVGTIPFILFYITPFVIGIVPTPIAELTVIFQALIPLAFAYSISSYKLVDFEVLLRKAAPLIFSYVVIAILYSVVSSQIKVLPENRLQVLIIGILAIILGATLFSPLKSLIQSLLDRVIYKRAYKYRKILLSISQELSRERNLQSLSKSLLELIANALSLDFIALLLPSTNEENTFYILQSRGQAASDIRQITFENELYQSLKNQDYLSSFSFSEKKELQKKFKELSSLGFYHFMPLKTEDRLIGCFGMGKKLDGTLLGSEDWELLRTISSPVALALENAYLYNQANLRAVELERLKDYSENIIESLTVGVAVLDQKGEIIGWNRVLEEIFSIKKNHIIGNKLSDVLGKKNYSALFPSDTQQDYRLLSEITLEMPSCVQKIFDIVKTPLLDNEMVPYGTIVVFEDITEKISLQQQLLTSEKLASIGLLSAGVAHEINTPLTGISSYVQILQKKLSDSPHTKILEKIDTQTERVARIVKNLLNFSRNPSESAFYQTDLKENLQSIISLIDYKLKNMNIGLELALAPMKSVWAQGERLQQVFINIILNAIDAMPGGGTLKIELTQLNNQAVIKISDTGTGIEPQHLPHIFDPFFTTKGIGKGTGLGLSISYAIIKEHAGKIAVESEPGKGSSFHIYIPMDLDKTNRKETSI